MVIPEFLKIQTERRETGISRAVNSTINMVNPMNLYNYYSSGSNSDSQSNVRVQDIADNISQMTKNIADNLKKKYRPALEQIVRFPKTPNSNDFYSPKCCKGDWKKYTHWYNYTYAERLVRDPETNCPYCGRKIKRV